MNRTAESPQRSAAGVKPARVSDADGRGFWCPCAGPPSGDRRGSGRSGPRRCPGLVLSGMAACIIAPVPAGSSSSSCRARPVSATRLITSRRSIQTNGQKFDPGGKVELFQSEPGAVMASPWKWRQYGQCGQWVSDLLPHLAGCVDDIAFLPAMVVEVKRSRARDLHAKHRVRASRVPQHGRLGLLRTGKLEPEPAHVRGACPIRGGSPPTGRPTGPPAFCPPRNQGTMVRPGAKNPDLRPVPARG